MKDFILISARRCGKNTLRRILVELSEKPANELIEVIPTLEKPILSVLLNAERFQQKPRHKVINAIEMELSHYE